MIRQIIWIVIIVTTIVLGTAAIGHRLSTTENVLIGLAVGFLVPYTTNEKRQ